VTVFQGVLYSFTSGEHFHDVFVFLFSVWPHPNTPIFTSPIFQIDGSGFLTDSKTDRLIWLPVHLRGECTVAPDGTIVIGSSGGALTFVKL
jgi:hypothetical protein